MNEGDATNALLACINSKLDRIAGALERLSNDMARVAESNAMLIRAISEQDPDEAQSASGEATAPAGVRTMDDA
jgi:hypothetical protein